MMETMRIGSREHPISGYLETQNGGVIPVVDIPMMSDERWNELALQNAVKNYTREVGHPPKTPEEAAQWQAEWLNTLHSGGGTHGTQRGEHRACAAAF